MCVCVKSGILTIQISRALLTLGLERIGGVGGGGAGQKRRIPSGGEGGGRPSACLPTPHQEQNIFSMIEEVDQPNTSASEAAKGCRHVLLSGASRSEFHWVQTKHSCEVLGTLTHIAFNGSRQEQAASCWAALPGSCSVPACTCGGKAGMTPLTQPAVFSLQRNVESCCCPIRA